MWNIVLYPAEVTSRSGDEGVNVNNKVRFRRGHRAEGDLNSHRIAVTVSRLTMKAPMLVLNLAYLVVGVLS